MAPFDDPDVGDVAVGVHYEAACDAAFDAVFVGIGRILTIFVDVVEECFLSTGEGGLFFYIVVFEHFFISLETVAGYTDGDAAGLGLGV